MQVLRILDNTREVSANFNTDWDEEYKKNFAVGATITVPTPQRFTIRNGLAYEPQGLNPSPVTITLDQVFGIDFQWDSYEQEVKLERSKEALTKKYFEPAARQLSQELDSRAAKFAYQNCPNVMGALGTEPTTPLPFLNAEALLYRNACPAGDRAMIISPTAMASFANSVPTFFNPAATISDIWKTGKVSKGQGWEWYRSNSLYSHTAGTVTSPTVTGANQSGSSLIITGSNGDTLKTGDKISIANVNFVNPQTRRIVGAPLAKMFTVLQDYTLTGGSDTISIYPAIVGPGDQYQNVDALPANGAAITLWPGTTSPNGKVGTVGLGISPWAFGMVGAELKLPQMHEPGSSVTKDPDSGLSVRFWRASDPKTSQMINRFDMCIGFGVLYADAGACCLAGA
jgi:hypothetical protein